MSENRPRAHDGLLHLFPAAESAAIRIGSPDWHDWLDANSSFRYETGPVAFTARKEKRAGGCYWYAQRRPGGKSQTFYLGKSEDLTVARLDAIAASFGASPEAAPRVDEAPASPLTAPQPHPAPLTPLVGRGEEVAAVTELLRRAEVRFVNLIGPGGIGKTRIAIGAAAALADSFSDGVYFLSLDPMRDAQLVLAHVAGALGLPVDGHRSLGELLRAALRGRRLLLVLDNLEQVTGAAPLLIDLLSYCAGLKMLVTSREILHLDGEYPFAVAPLPFPASAALSLGDLRNYPAAELFLQRAQAIMPDLALDEAAVGAIAEICARLEGLPLAIELAAARVRFLPPQVLLRRLAGRLAILTQGGPGRPARQQTLRATLDWSHELLTPDEQVVFRRLAIFSGGCDLDAAEAVCAACGDVATPLLDVLSSLVDKSLLLAGRHSGESARFRLSETVKEYALEALAHSGELEAVEEAHAAHYLHFALRAEPELEGRDQDEWLARLDLDYQNLTAALHFLLAGHDRPRAVRLAGALGRYWYVRGRLSEGLDWIERALGWRTGSMPAAEERKALYIAGLFAIHLDQGERARPWLEQSLELCRVAGDTAGYALSAHLLTLFFLLKSNLPAAQSHVERALAFIHKSTDAWALATAHSTWGTLAVYLGEFARARTLFERSAALFAEVNDPYLRDLMLLLASDALIAEGDKSRAQLLIEAQIRQLEQKDAAWGAGYLLCAYGRFALRREDWSRARVLLEQSLALFRRLRDPRGMARACLFLAQTALYQQDYSTAIATARQCLENARAADAVATIIGCLEELADVAVQRNKPGWAAQLWGAAERQREAADPERRPTEPAERAQFIRQARESLGTKVFADAWNEGRSLSLEQLLSVENVSDSVANHPALSAQRPAGLTRRELEVLLLVADGLSNSDIAERLVISPATVVSYLNLVYRKLDVSSRTAAMRYVIDHQLR